MGQPRWSIQTRDLQILISTRTHTPKLTQENRFYFFIMKFLHQNKNITNLKKKKKKKQTKLLSFDHFCPLGSCIRFYQQIIENLVASSFFIQRPQALGFASLK